MAAPIRVGIDSHYAEADGEGNTTYTRNLLRAVLVAGGPDDRFTLLAADPGHPFYRSLPASGRWRDVRVRQGRGLWRVGLALGRAARRAGVECLHVQYAGPLASGPPVVVTVHDLSFLHLPASFPRFLRLALRVMVSRTVARAARVITCSDFCRRDIEAHYPAARGKVRIIPLGVAPAFRPRRPAETAAVLERYGLRPGFVFALSRLNRRKNLERLLMAHALARTGGAADRQLVIGGKPDYGTDDVLKRARLLDEERAVRFAGLIPEDDLPHFYAGAACFVYPSLFEGFGLPVLEAMACGTPVIASDRTALPELVGPAGLLVDPERVDAIAGAMARILGNPALAGELGRLGLERSARYSWGETARQTLDVYREAQEDAR